ncbi:Endoglucanase-5 [Dactylellina cionopaga]|nr:Endoglucanase-5 [Dactylellina cionopaga]
MYYDCCKPACAWHNVGDDFIATPLQVCDKDDKLITDNPEGAASYCDGGPASACTAQQPWAVNDTFSYGYASIFIAGDEVKDWCCSCYELEFTTTSIQGKKMVIQAINVNFNEDQANFFSLTVPGQADWAGKCSQRFGGDFGTFFGKGNSGGVQTPAQCSMVPESVRPSCEWRYSWYEDVFGPNITFRRVECPTSLTDKSGCTRKDDYQFAASSASSSNSTKSTDTNMSPATTVISYSSVSLAALLYIAFSFFS